jgi:uncharacterized protein
MTIRPAVAFMSVLVVFLSCLCATASAVDVPYLQGRVTDGAELLSQEAVDRISTLLEQHEAKTSDQVAVLTVSSLAGESVESYALQVFDTWKLGRKGKDNGVLVLIAPHERRMRIEVGYGLEGSLTDLEAGRIIRNIMTPRFKANDFEGGIEQGVQAIIGQLEGGGDLPADPEPRAKSGGSLFEEPDLDIIPRILIGCFVFGIIGLFTGIGILTPGMGWFLYFFLIPFWAMFPIIVVGTKATFVILAVYLIGFPVTKVLLSRQKWYSRAKRDLKTKGAARIGGFTLFSGGRSGSSGSRSWSSGSSGFSSGSGFSGGGGSSGGGGASGSW